MFEVTNALAYFRELARTGKDEPEWGWPHGAPSSEFTRSPAACRVARLAAESGLYLFHYEHRHQVELPSDWVPEHAPGLAEAAAWQEGVLPERKYQSFQHDQMIGSFHPGHRAKWSTHELCHGLVGFAWQRSATPFFVATAGRLAELLPVVLWYFLDEVFLGRCPIHAYGGALFREHCEACERLASPDLGDPHARERVQDAVRFLERELAAVARSRRLGRPVPHVYGSLNLCSDGVAYAVAHRQRLASDVFGLYAEMFLVPGQGWHPSLADLEARIEAVARAICVGAPLTPLAPSPVHGRWRWLLQDVAWRILVVAHQTEGEVQEGLLGLVEQLAETANSTATLSSDPAVDCAAVLERVYAAYSGWFDAVVLPLPVTVMGTGAPFSEPAEFAATALLEGLRSALPLTATLLGESLKEWAQDFAREDRPRRKRLAIRFEQWIQSRVRGPLLDLIRYETMIASLPPVEAEGAWSGGAESSERWRVAGGIRVGCFEVDPVELAKDVEFGDVVWTAECEVVDVDGAAIAQDPRGLIVQRMGTGEVQLVEVSWNTAKVLQAGSGISLEDLDEDEGRALVDLAVLIPQRWRLDESK